MIKLINEYFKKGNLIKEFNNFLFFCSFEKFY